VTENTIIDIWMKRKVSSNEYR